MQIVGVSLLILCEEHTPLAELMEPNRETTLLHIQREGQRNGEREKEKCSASTCNLIHVFMSAV